MWKLNWKIVGIRSQEVQIPDLDKPKSDGTCDIKLSTVRIYDIEWTHADGPIAHYCYAPVTHPPNIRYEKRETGKHPIVKDQVNVDAHLTEDIQLRIVAAELERKRSRLAECLGIEP